MKAVRQVPRYPLGHFGRPKTPFPGPRLGGSTDLPSGAEVGQFLTTLKLNAASGVPLVRKEVRASGGRGPSVPLWPGLGPGHASHMSERGSPCHITPSRDLGTGGCTSARAVCSRVGTWPEPPHVLFFVFLFSRESRVEDFSELFFSCKMSQSTDFRKPKQGCAIVYTCVCTADFASWQVFGRKKQSDLECGTFDKTLLQNIHVPKDKKCWGDGSRLKEA